MLISGKRGWGGPWGVGVGVGGTRGSCCDAGAEPWCCPCWWERISCTGHWASMELRMPYICFLFVFFRFPYAISYLWPQNWQSKLWWKWQNDNDNEIHEFLAFCCLPIPSFPISPFQCCVCVYVSICIIHERGRSASDYGAGKLHHSGLIVILSMRGHHTINTVFCICSVFCILLYLMYLWLWDCLFCIRTFCIFHFAALGLLRRNEDVLK